MLLVQPLDLIFCKILTVLIILMTIDSLFLLKQGLSRFHLSAFKAIYIKTSNPAHCRQKEFMYSVTYNNFECLNYDYLLCFNVYVTASLVLPPF